MKNSWCYNYHAVIFNDSSSTMGPDALVFGSLSKCNYLVVVVSLKCMKYDLIFVPDTWYFVIEECRLVSHTKTLHNFQPPMAKPHLPSKEAIYQETSHLVIYI